MAKCLSQPESFHRVNSPNNQSSISMGSKLRQFVVPANESSVYWSVTLTYLIPVKDDKDSFEERYKALFGSEETILSHLESVRTTIQNYNPLSDVIPDDNKLRDLIRKTFHDRVCNYMLDKRFEIKAMCEMLNATISVAGVNGCQYGDMGTQMQLFHVDLSTTGGARNHYNFSLDDNIIDGYQGRLLDDTLTKLEKSFNCYSTDDVEDNSLAKPLQTSEITFDCNTIEYIAKIKWYGSKVIFKVTSEYELKSNLKGYLDELKKLENIDNVLVVMIDLNNLHWVALVVHYKENEFYGHYIDSTGQVLPDSVKNTWKEIENKDIVDYTIDGKNRADQSNSGLFAFEDASRIIKSIKNGDITKKRKMTKQLMQNSESSQADIAKKLSAKSKMEDKIKVCSEILSLDNISNWEKFSTKNLNIFLFFLEAISLDDASLLGNDYLDKVKSQIIGRENSALANEIRNYLFLHRKHSKIIIESNIDIEMRKILKNNITCKQFFRSLSEYVFNVNKQLERDGGQTLSQNISEPKDLLISKKEFSTISFGTVLSDNEPQEELSKLFKEIIKQIGSTPDDKGGDTILFNLIVNIIPILGRLYSNPESKSRNALSPKGLEQIRKFRNDFLHNFHAQGDNNQERNFLLKQGIHDLLDYFFKYYFIRKVCKKFYEASSQTLRQDISDLLENTQRDFKNNYYIFEPAVERGDELSNFVCDYIKLMSIIDNEVVKDEREANFKESKNQVLHRKLKAIDRKMIYNHFKELRKSHPSTECFDAKALGKKLRIEYGILIKPIYIEQMFEYYVKNKNQCGQFEDTEIVDIVNNDIRALKRITKYYPISNQKVIKLYDMFINGQDISHMLNELQINQQMSIKTKLDSLQSKKHKLINLSTYFEMKDEKGSRIDVIVDIVETIKNILEMLDDHIEYPFLSLDIDDIFSDEIVLDYLVNEKINITKDLLSVFLKVDYITPYVVSLIANNEIPLELITPEDVSNIIDNLLLINHAECIGNLLNELSPDQFQQIYKDIGLENAKDAVYQELCEKVNQDNIRSTYCLLENLDHVKGILKALNKYPNKNKLLNKALRETAFTLYCKEEYEKLRDINDLLKKDSSDSDVLQIRRYVALERRKSGHREEAFEIFQTIQDKLEHEKCSLYLLVLNDVAQTKHFMKDFDGAYKDFKYLYDTLMQQLDIKSDKLSYEIYCDVMKSEKYRTFLALDSKNLNILKIQSSIAHELQCIAGTKTETTIQDYQDALNIYEVTFEIIRTHAVFSNDMPKILYSLASMHNTLAHIDSDRKLEHQYKALEMYTMILTVQNKLYWKTHPVVEKTWYDIINVICSMAFSISRLGDFNKYSDPVEAQQHYEKALRVFEQIFKHGKFDKDIPSYIGLMNNKLGDFQLRTDPVKALRHYEEALKMFTLQNEKLCEGISVIRNIAYTNNKLGNIKQSRNQHQALQHYEKALALYKHIQAIQAEERYKNGDIENTNNNDRDVEKAFNCSEQFNEIQNLEPGKGNCIARDIGYTNRKLGDLKRPKTPTTASRHYEEALKIYEEIYDKDNNVANDLAILNKKLGDLKQSTDPQVARGHFEEAVKFYKHVQLFQQTSFGEEHLYTQINIANLYVGIGMIESRNDNKNARNHYEKAIEILEKVVAVQKRTLGENHFATNKTANRLWKIKDLLKNIQWRK